MVAVAMAGGAGAGAGARELVAGPVLLLGAPGVGKGTQAKAIMAAWGVPQISTGEILRENVRRETQLGLQAKRVMDRGELVSDAIVNAMVADRIGWQDTRAGFLLDGYPRTVGQAEFLDRTLGASNGSGIEASNGPSVSPIHEGAAGLREGATLPLLAIAITVPYGTLLQRITGRRTCPLCQHPYNVYLQPPRVDGICDIDGTPLMQRDDDALPVFERRMRAYAEQTAAVVEHYRAQGRFREVDGDRAVETVTAAIMHAVAAMRG